MTNSHVPIVFCDTCVLIHMLNMDNPAYEHIEKSFLNDAKNGLVRVGISEVTVAETCNLAANIKIDVSKTVEEYLARPYMRRYPLAASASAYAAALIRICRLDTCDALIVGTALTLEATKLYTRDSSSLCKRIRSTRKSPAYLNAIKQNDAIKEVFTFADEKQLFKALANLDVIEVVIPVPAKSGEKTAKAKAT